VATTSGTRELPKPCRDTVDAWAQLLRASQRLLREVERELKDAGFPPLSWYDVLRELAAAEGHRLRQFELEERLALAQYNLSRLVDRLEARGLVRREGCPSDRRGNFVIATPEGQALKARMWPVYEQAIARHFGRALSGADARSLAAVLRPFAGP
jgi:DNA-binding MarR family transcriptional regulator